MFDVDLDLDLDLDLWSLSKQEEKKDLKTSNPAASSK